jgi:hypothetical protein
MEEHVRRQRGYLSGENLSHQSIGRVKCADTARLGHPAFEAADGMEKTGEG